MGDDDSVLKWFYVAMICFGISSGIGLALSEYYAHVEKMEMIKAGIYQPEKKDEIKN